MNLSRTIVLASAALVALAVGPRLATAGELDNKLDSLARKVADFLEKKGQEKLAVGEITGPAFPRSSSGPGVQQILIAALKTAKIQIVDKAELTLKGEYLIIEDDDRKDELIVRVLIQVRNKLAESLLQISEELTPKHGGNNDMIKLLGLNVDLSEHKNADPPKANKEIKKQLEKPPLNLDETKVKTRADSQVAVEVLVQKGGKGQFVAVEPKEVKGLAFVELDKGDVYRLRLTNNTKLEAVAVVTIDGLEAFRFFKPAEDRPVGFLIKKGTKREIEGWPLSTEEGAQFLVGSLSDALKDDAKALRASNSLGTINVCFHPCWEGKDPPEEDEGARSVEPNITLAGDKFKRKTEVKTRTIGPLLTAITIRYDKK